MTAAKLHTGFVDTGPERIYYESVGEGTALVLSHGLGGSHAVWYQQVPEFAPDYRVVTWDQRGFGRSTADSGRIGPGPATDDLERVLDFLGIERAHLVGQSLGGWCTMGLALRHPDRVCSVVLADSLGGIWTPEIILLIAEHGRAELPPNVPDLGVHPAVDGLDRRDLTQAFLYQQLSSFFEPPDQAQIIGLMLQDPPDLDAVKAFERPLLFLHGSEDQLFPPESIRAAAKFVPHAELVEIEGSAHSPYFEDAPAWNAAVRNFLSSLPS